jgi:hypothetical protein
MSSRDRLWRNGVVKREERRSPLHTGAESLGLLLLMACLLAITNPFYGQHQSNGKATVRQSQDSKSGRPLSADNYRKLRTQALANAKTQLIATVKNPQTRENGLDRATVEALRQQRAYLESARPVSPTTKNPAQAQGATSNLSPASHRTSLLRAYSGPRSGAPAEAHMCTAPRIRTVNGKSTGVIFTPQAPSNYYKIEGCSFGSVRGQLQLVSRERSLRQSLPRVVLHLDNSITSWSDREIDAYMDPHLGGMTDFPASLVVYPKRGHPLEVPGCFFVAARGEPQLLRGIPASWVTLEASTVRSRSIDETEYLSPAAQGTGVPSDAIGTSAFVVRSNAEQFGSGTDIYDLSHLNSGWVVDSVQLQTYEASCPGEVTRVQFDGEWGTSWTRHGFELAWRPSTCASRIPPDFGFNLAYLQYAAKVWVIGPAGTQPLRGKSSR